MDGQLHGFSSEVEILEEWSLGTYPLLQHFHPRGAAESGARRAGRPRVLRRLVAAGARGRQDRRRPRAGGVPVDAALRPRAGAERRAPRPATCSRSASTGRSAAGRGTTSTNRAPARPRCGSSRRCVPRPRCSCVASYVARPLLVWNHHRMMRGSEQGLRRQAFSRARRPPRRSRAPGRCSGPARCRSRCRPRRRPRPRGRAGPRTCCRARRTP